MRKYRKTTTIPLQRRILSCESRLVSYNYVLHVKREVNTATKYFSEVFKIKYSCYEIYLVCYEVNNYSVFNYLHCNSRFREDEF